MSNQNTEGDTLRHPSRLWPWMRAFLTLECLILIALAAVGVYVSLLQTALVRLDLDKLTFLTFVIIYIQLANVLLFLCSAYFTARLVHRTTLNAHLLAPDQIKRPVAGVVGHLSSLANALMSPRALRQVWRGTFGGGAAAEERARLIVWWWATGLACVLAGAGASLARGSDPFTFSPLASALSVLSYAFAAAFAALLLRVFRLITRAQELLIERRAS